MRVWWVAGAAVVVTFVVAVRRTVLLRARRSRMTLSPVSDQWLADHKRDRRQ